MAISDEPHYRRAHLALAAAGIYGDFPAEPYAGGPLVVPAGDEVVEIAYDQDGAHAVKRVRDYFADIEHFRAAARAIMVCPELLGGPLIVRRDLITPLMREWFDVEDEVDIASVTRDVARES